MYSARVNHSRRIPSLYYNNTSSVWLAREKRVCDDQSCCRFALQQLRLRIDSEGAVTLMEAGRHRLVLGGGCFQARYGFLGRPHRIGHEAVVDHGGGVGVSFFITAGRDCVSHHRDFEAVLDDVPHVAFQAEISNWPRHNDFLNTPAAQLLDHVVVPRRETLVGGRVTGLAVHEVLLEGP